MTTINTPRPKALSALISAALLSSLGAANTVVAQERTMAIEEIIVTAQRREQSMQEVPIAVTAVTPDALKNNRVRSVMDLTGLAPGLMTRTNAGSLGSPSFSMRGVFASASMPAQDRQVSTYIDGVYIGGVRGSVFDLPDLQRIEVLRGPQGTLFGRNATAGAVNIVTRDPTGEFGGTVEGTMGNYGQFRTRLTLEMPAVGPFSGYVTYVHDQREGDVDNLGAGTVFDYSSPFTSEGLNKSPRTLGDRDFDNFFVAARFEPASNFSMTYKFDHSDGTNTPEARATTVVNPNSFVGGMLLGVIAAQPAGGGAYGPVPFFPNNKRPSAVNNAWTQEGYQKAAGHSLTTVWDIADNLSLKNVTAYRETEIWGPSTIMGLSGLEFTPGALQAYAPFATISALGAGFFALTPAQQAAAIGATANALSPLIGSYFAGYEGNGYGEYDQVSTEFQLNYTSDFVTVTAGALWFESEELSSALPGMPANLAFQPVPQLLPLGNVQESIAKVKSMALYTQGEFHLTPRLDLSLGARITRDEKDGSLRVGGMFVGDRDGEGSIVGTTSFPWEFKETKPTYSVGLNYKLTDDMMVYGKYSTAFLSGGAVGQLSFASEEVTSWEAGMKADWLDGRLRTNLAVYHAVYEDIQSAQGGVNVGQPQLGVVVIDNGELTAKGVELEVSASPVAGLMVGGSMGYTNTSLKNPNPVVAQGREYRATAMPEWIGSVYAQYVTAPLIGDAAMYFRVDGNYQGKDRSIPFPDIATAMPVFAPYEFYSSRWIFNGRVALQNIALGAADAEISLWGRNLLNNKDPVYALLFGDIQHNASYVPARTYGLDVVLNF